MWAIRSRPASMQIFGSCVVLPEPVSPATITTWLSRISAAIRSASAAIGRFGSTVMRGVGSAVIRA